MMMSHLWEILAVAAVLLAGIVALVYKDPTGATWAAGAAIAFGTLALVHEHRDRP